MAGVDMKIGGKTFRERLFGLSVIVILCSIITAILMPLPHRNRENPRRAACQQNLRQLSLAMAQYRADSAGYFPAVNGNTRFYGWADTLLPYSRNAGLFQCPAEDTPRGIDDPTAPPYTDYFYNARLEGKGVKGVKFPTATVMLGDAKPGSARQHSTGGNPKPPGIAVLIDRDGIPIGAAQRHLDGANYAFVDGHVKWLKGLDDNTTPALRANASGAKAPTFAIN